MGKINIEDLLPVWCKIKKIKIEENISSISSLAPKILSKDDLEKVQPYLDKLKDTLNTKGINNIALTGGYGSGKSTLLKTFQYWNENNFNFLNISLAAFNQSKTKENFKELYELKIKNGKSEKEAEKEISNEFKETLISNEELEKQLEISILQQIIYKVKPSNLPESRFKRIINIPNWKLYFLIPLSFILWISSIILLFKYDYLDNLNPNTWIIKNGLDWGSFFIFLIAFLGIGYFSKLVVELFSNSKINKVNLNGEIEIGDNSSKSILNEHYDEILYYFEKNNFNVVVIEDLDRFDNTNIFTKLRELNILLNNADSINSKLCYRDFGIKFLYAVGDDLFNDKKERVKFFEYIIPVIPFINSSNANDQLKTLIKESELEENVFPKEFLSDITTFIDDIDMRLLINIFHEFVIYRNVLKPDALIGREAELFAMITYKNIDPEDFNKLNSKKGKLYKLINDKKIYVQKLILAKDLKITNKKTDIENIKTENISDVEELKPIYLIKISEKIPNATELNISNRKLRFNDLMSDDLFNEVVNTTNFRYYQNGHGIYNSNISFGIIENDVNPNFTYNERVKLIESKHNSKIDAIQKEIEKLKTEKFDIENWDLKQIFNEIDINQYLNKFSNNGLLRNLILEGYINENYNDYISLFHEVSLTKEDKKFERNVKSGVNEGFEYKLTHIENLIDNHIELKYFKRETILNFDLLDYLGENYSTYSEKYDSIIELISNEKEKSIEFIDRYILVEDRPLEIFIEKTVENWKGLWEHCYNNYVFEKQYKYLKLIIENCTVDSILEHQNNEKLKEALEQNINFIKLIKTEDGDDYYITSIDKISDLIKKLDIKFNSLDVEQNKIEKLIEYIYKNNYYKINKENIIQILKTYGENINFDDFETSNYYQIMSTNCTHLIDYINSEINIYIKDVYLKLENNNKEKEESLIDLLNDDKLDLNLKKSIINKTETKISDLSLIDDSDIYSLLLENNKLVPNWENLLYEYNNNNNNNNNRYIEEEVATDSEDVGREISESVINFINEIENAKELSLINVPKEVNSINIYGKFWKKLIQINEITDESYQIITKLTPWWYNSLDFETLSENKIKLLIENNCINPDVKSYNSIKEFFNGLNIFLLEKRKLSYFKILDQLIFDSDDLEIVLKSRGLTNLEKQKILNLCSDETIIKNNILKLLSSLLLADNSFVVNDTILSSIINNISVPINERLIIFNKNSNKYDIPFIQIFLTNLGGFYLEITDKNIKAK
ncbi:MAG: hypothetical protein A3G95_07110, partial [Flavobacteria bacterium RIFCSPLOWO2_12_FULL_31_7]